ncbi:putative oligopeptide ABC transporter, oligopeptide-binding protein AppA [uncultured Desulfatiglans sp.]|uniref:Putative oligopeptide ABC transporter, oligopeptide-binding protein AppA n=1 Tax=Uncultured Desulfatiglans sp. TaxID=1748965 RepID=A0A653A864_UNCDX|nr:putative oligopeptide ABC transporter, oligopeptide-binding protein AppA [uncultured Desulfatiglans sp.]
MTVKRLLLWVPLALMLFLVQAYFWVPSYEEQTRGNPERLESFITGSIGDASILNPILSADSASSEINALVFEGLLDRDEELRLRGRLAESWEIREEAWFYLNPAASETGGADGAEVVARLIKARGGLLDLPPEVAESLAHIQGVEVLPARTFTETRKVRQGSGEGEETGIELTVHAPERIRLSLDRVDPEIFDRLRTVLGEEVFAPFQSAGLVQASAPIEEALLVRLAEELLPQTEHNPIVTFRLRPGVRFHDGHPVTARDVRFTYDAIMDPRNLSPRVSDYEPVKSVEVPDPLTVRIVYKRLYSPALASWGMGILPEHLLNAEALKREAAERGMDPEAFSMRQSRFNRRPVGCGPFVFKEWRSDQHIELTRFEDYWEGAPNYRRYVYRVIPDLLTQEMEFYAGTVDNYAVQPHQVERLSRDPRFQSFSGVSFGYTYIAYNLRREPFNDARVRRALGMAIDVEKIIRFVLYGQGERITGPFVKQTDFYDHSIEPLPYDPEAALALLAEAGWRRGPEGWLEKGGRRLQFTLITNGGNDTRKAILAIAQDAWKQIGIDVRTDILEWSVFIEERVNKQDFDALVLGWSMGVDPDLFQIWHSSQTKPFHLNFAGFANEAADDLILRIRETYDHDRQVRYCNDLHAIIAEEQPYTFLYVGKWTAILDQRIVIQRTDASGDRVYERIKPTKTGSYTFHFNRWIKLPHVPDFAAEG